MTRKRASDEAIRVRRERAKRESLARFNQFADKSGGPQACWLWTGKMNADGYGTGTLDGHAVGAHGVGYRLLVGPVPEGLELDHVCRNRACVNPAHLEPVTHKTNVLRGTSKIANHARQTHCKHGHAFDAKNTAFRLQPNGITLRRACRECHRIRSKLRRQRIKENTL